MADYNPTGKPRIERAGVQRGGPLPVSDPSNSPFEQAVWNTMKELGDLLLSKHRDYGPKNISQSPYGVIRGLITRMWDKMARMVNLTNSNDKPFHEPLEDSFKDMANYSVIAIMELRGQWPKE